MQHIAIILDCWAQDSVPFKSPELQHPLSDTLYLEAWRGLKPIGYPLSISVADLLQVGRVPYCSS